MTTTMKRGRWMIGAAMVLAAGAAAAGPGLKVIVAPTTSPVKVRKVDVRRAPHPRPTTLALDATTIAALKTSLLQSLPKPPPSAQPQNLNAPLTVTPLHPQAAAGSVSVGVTVASSNFADWIQYEVPPEGSLGLVLHGLAQGALYLVDCSIDGHKYGGAIVPATFNQVFLDTNDATGAIVSHGVTPSVTTQNGHFIYGFMNPIDGQDGTAIVLNGFTGGEYFTFTGCTVHPS